MNGVTFGFLEGKVIDIKTIKLRYYQKKFNITDVSLRSKVLIKLIIHCDPKSRFQNT